MNAEFIINHVANVFDLTVEQVYFMLVGGSLESTADEKEALDVFEEHGYDADDSNYQEAFWAPMGIFPADFDRVVAYCEEA